MWLNRKACCSKRLATLAKAKQKPLKEVKKLEAALLAELHTIFALNKPETPKEKSETPLTSR